MASRGGETRMGRRTLAGRAIAREDPVGAWGSATRMSRAFDRRGFLLGASAILAVPSVSLAQAPKRLPVIGFLSPHSRPSPEAIAKSPFAARLRELGWREGETFLAERAFGEGSEERLPELAAMLVAKGVDLIWALGPEAAVAAARATVAIPIVFWGVAWPIEQGLIHSYSKPGRNVTGVAWQAGPEVNSKRMQFLIEIAPDARRLAQLNVPSAQRTVAGERLTAYEDGMNAAARNRGLELRSFPVLKPDDFEPAFAAIAQWGAQALIVSGTTLTVREMKRIIEFARRQRLPAVYTLRDFVEAGGLVSYAVDWRPTMVRSMDYVDRVLRGAKPAELPVELPTQYELAVNLGTARALGLTVPQSILLSADKVIE